MMDMFLPLPQPIVIASFGEFNFKRSALAPIISPLSLPLAQLRRTSLRGVDAGCDVNVSILVCSKMTRLRLMNTVTPPVIRQVQMSLAG